MDFGFTAEQEKFRQEVRGFFEEAVKPDYWFMDPEGEERRAIGRGIDKEMVRRGWWVPHWPKEYGGQDMDHINFGILNEEEGYWEVPNGGGHGRIIFGPALMKFGTEEQKKKYLPPIARADLVVCLGYTEPNAGSDLAAMETRAELHGDEFIVNGHKTFITFGHFADVMLLAARTDPTVAKHRGITLFILDMHSPGIRVSPILCLGGPFPDGNHVNDVYLEDVRIPKGNIIGELNRGFYHMATALNFERSGLRFMTPNRHVFDMFVDLCKKTYRHGKPLTEDPSVRSKLMSVAMDLEAWRSICWRVVHMQKKGEVPTWEASESELFRKETTPRLGRTIFEIMDMYGMVEPGSEWAQMRGRVERLWRHGMNIHGQGGKSVTRNVIARRGLDMPRGM